MLQDLTGPHQNLQHHQGEPKMELHQIIEHQRALQHLIIGQLHLISLHRLVHQIGQHHLVRLIGLPHPDHRVHLDLQGEVAEAGVEEDRNIVVQYSNKKKRLFKMNSLFIISIFF